MSPTTRGWITRVSALLFITLLSLITVLKTLYGGGSRFPERVLPPPLFPATALEVVAEFPTPPSTVAVSQEGRIFASLHPDALPDIRVAEVVDGALRPFPTQAFQSGRREPRAFRDVRALRIDGQNRLWVLDSGRHGLWPPRLLAFSLANGAVVHEYTFPRTLAGRGSLLRDFQISADSRHLYLSDASYFAQRPALIVYDTQRREARRLLESHRSLLPDRHTPHAQGRRMEIFGLLSLRPGVGPLALSRDGHWLYYSAMTDTDLHRLQVTDLLDRSLSSLALAQRVQTFASKTVTDGLSSDDPGYLYLGDPEHSRLLRMAPNGQMETLVQSDALRWPSGLGFGPDGALYIAASATHQVLGRLPWQVRHNGPYPLYRLPLDTVATPGQ